MRTGRAQIFIQTFSDACERLDRILETDTQTKRQNKSIVAAGGGSRRNSFTGGNSFTLGEIVLRLCFRQNFKFGKFKN